MAGPPPFIEQSIDVDAPIQQTYDQWTQFEDFPSSWRASSASISSTSAACTGGEIGGETHEWDAEIIEQQPDERVAWRNVEGKDNAGAVTFHKIDDGTTRVMVQMDLAPEGIKEKGRRARRGRSPRQGRPRALQGLHRVARRRDRRLAR